MRLWVWRHVRIELPDDWEMLQFSRESEVGRCAFADRYQFRLEFHWRVTDGVPDVRRLMSDYLAKLRLDGSLADAAPAQAGDWLGLEGRQGDGFTSRFGRHLPEESCLLEIAFLWPEGRDTALEASILGSVAAEPKHPGGLRRWRAFGLELLATDGLRLSDCTVAPACARMTFAGSASDRWESFERLGMVSEWLDRPVRDWLRGQAPRDVLVQAASSATVAGHATETVRGRRRLRPLARLLRGPAAYEATAWLCPADGRLYRVSALGPEAGAGTGRPSGKLACCENLRRLPEGPVVPASAGAWASAFRPSRVPGGARSEAPEGGMK